MTVKKTGLANHFGFQAKTQSGGGTKPNREEVPVEPLMISSKYPFGHLDMVHSVI